MKYKQVEKLGGERFRRLTGVKRRTFENMVVILTEAEKKQKQYGGRKNKLSIENRLLMMLEYLREYRTYFHIGQSYCVSESTAFKTIRWAEDILAHHPDFQLPGKKALYDSNRYEEILIDATETPIERPKKNNRSITPGKRKDTQ